MSDIVEVSPDNYLDIARDFEKGGYVIMPGGGLSTMFCNFGFDLAGKGKIKGRGNYAPAKPLKTTIVYDSNQ